MSKSFSTTFMITALIYFILGVAMVAWPETARLVICYAVGILLILYGLGRVLSQWNSLGFLSLGNGYLMGLVYLLLGVLLLISADVVLAIFGTVLGLVIVADSIIKLQISYQLKGSNMGSSRRNAICALVTLTLGLLMLFSPFKAVNAMTIFIGISLLVDGIINFIIALDVRRFLHDTVTMVE
ncbi:MAG: hypothetical protein EOM66_00575 [Clostridia bacterium]|nr:DUF308 domain-containing protein [Candidatus Pelethousia sp.]NCB29884.1 hypothetical protein [Clostridia bacterium]